ncbi:hypothetical protein K457DRAFT_135451 [Linnemannia elongata AG-77]|uniref:Uncharacterized protein n=1 Tax=Linnemannia elongata AG-77 TaxID=1314771 RepID=A0A197K3B0_9FUNG|nr:hypothetical protein K457DRAFT_135451 [Linnemannia elongata AG-77]
MKKTLTPCILLLLLLLLLAYFSYLFCCLLPPFFLSSSFPPSPPPLFPILQFASPLCLCMRSTYVFLDTMLGLVHR